jgi:hypothetical protein
MSSLLTAQDIVTGTFATDRRNENVILARAPIATPLFPARGKEIPDPSERDLPISEPSIPRFAESHGRVESRHVLQPDTIDANNFVYRMEVRCKEECMLLQTEPAAFLNRPNPFGSLFREIAETARATLRRSPYFELRDLSCDFSGGVLTLNGRVPSYHLKQLAQTAVAGVPGVIEIDNHVEVG